MPKKIEIENPQGKSSRNTWFKIIFILVNVVTIAILLIVELSKGSIADFSYAMQVLGKNIHWLFFALGVFFVKFMSDTLCYYILIKDTTGESRLSLSTKICLIGKYGDGITPMGTGGQPFQIYYLHKYNIELSKAASIPLVRVAFKILGYNLTMLFFFVFFSQEGSVFVKTTAYVALFINSLFPFIIMVFGFKRSWGLKLTEYVLKLGYRFKIVKDYDKAHKYWIKKVDDMLKSIKYFNTHPFLFFSVLGLSVIEIICLATVPFLVFRAFGGDPSVSWIFIATSTMYVLSASILAPTPGTSGVAEGTFYAIFQPIITGGLLFYTIITWRLITFYVYIFGGIILLIYESIYKKKAYIDARDERKGRMTNKKRRMIEQINDQIQMIEETKIDASAEIIDTPSESEKE